MWIFYALLSALSAASRRTSEKRLTHQLNHFSISFATQAFSLPAIIAAGMLTHSLSNPLHAGLLRFWLPAVGVTIVFYPLSAGLYLKAIKNDDLSSVLPVQSLGPIFGALIALVTLREIPSVLAVAAIALIVLGVYVLGLKGRYLHHPFAMFRGNKATRYMLLNTALATAVSIPDKIASQAATPLTYSLVSTLLAVLVLYVTMQIRGVHELRQIVSRRRELTIIGSLQGVSYSTFLLGLAAGPVAYVSAIRSSNVIIGSLLGVALLKERLTWQKIVSLSLISVGIVLLAFTS